MVMSQPGSTSSRKPVHQDRRPRPIDLRNLHPLAPQPQPALPPRPRPGGTGYDVFWAKLTWIVQRWNRIDRFNGNKWTPLDWQNGWARVITPEWWRTQASDSKNLELVLETLNQDNPITDIHHPDFPSLAKTITLGVQAPVLFPNGFANSWLRQVAMHEVSTWATQYLPAAQGTTTGRLQNDLKDVIAELAIVCTPDLDQHYERWYTSVALPVGESIAREDHQYLSRGVVLLRACLRMVQKTRNFEDGAVMGSCTLVSFFLPTLEEFRQFCRPGNTPALRDANLHINSDPAPLLRPLPIANPKRQAPRSVLDNVDTPAFERPIPSAYVPTQRLSPLSELSRGHQPGSDSAHVSPSYLTPRPSTLSSPSLAVSHLLPLGASGHHNPLRQRPLRSSIPTSSRYPLDRHHFSAHPLQHSTYPHKQSLVPSQVFEPPEVIHPPSLDELIDRISRIYEESDDESGHLARLQLGKLLRIGKPHMEGAEATARAYLKRLLGEATILGNRPKVSQLPNTITEARECNERGWLCVPDNVHDFSFE